MHAISAYGYPPGLQHVLAVVLPQCKALADLLARNVSTVVNQSVTDATTASVGPSTSQQTNKGTKKTFYKRKLPSPPAVAFSSPEGRVIFQEALQQGTMSGFFKLIEQYCTQDEPAFCGLASLAMVLNALSIDPRRTWKGNWRWFHEKLLDCCLPVETVAAQGIILSQTAHLAKCNGAEVSLFQSGSFTLDHFRRHIEEVCQTGDEHLIVSYSRKKFLQTGDGHYSPIGGYHRDRDLALILDTARFKYPPHWVPIPLLYEAMELPDPATNMPRGFMRLAARNKMDSVLFTLDIRTNNWMATELFVRCTAPELMRVMTTGEEPVGGEKIVERLLCEVPLDSLNSFIVLRDASPSCTRDRCVPYAARNQLLNELRNVPLYTLVKDYFHHQSQVLRPVVEEAGPICNGEGRGAVGFTGEEGLAGAGSSCRPVPVHLDAAASAAPSSSHHHCAVNESRSHYSAGEPLPDPSSTEDRHVLPGGGNLRHTLLPEKACMLLLMIDPSSWSSSTPCNSGSRQQLEALLDVTSVSIVQAEVDYLREQLKHIEEVVQAGSLDPTCGSCDSRLDCATLGHLQSVGAQ